MIRPCARLQLANQKIFEPAFARSLALSPRLTE